MNHTRLGFRVSKELLKVTISECFQYCSACSLVPHAHKPFAVSILVIVTAVLRLLCSKIPKPLMWELKGEFGGSVMWVVVKIRVPF